MSTKNSPLDGLPAPWVVFLTPKQRELLQMALARARREMTCPDRRPSRADVLTELAAHYLHLIKES